MICARCGDPIPDGADCMRLAGQPPEGRSGPRLLELTLCGDCASLLARFLAGPVAAAPMDPAPHN